MSTSTVSAPASAESEVYTPFVESDANADAAELRASLHDAIENGSLAIPRWRRPLPFLLRVRIWFSYRVARLLLHFYGYDRLH